MYKAAPSSSSPLPSSSAQALRAGNEAQLSGRRYRCTTESNDTMSSVKTGARQVLPVEECEFLRALTGAQLKCRARELHEAGWTLAAIAAAWDPPRQRSSVRAWVLSPQANPPAVPHTRPVPSPDSPPASSFSSSFSSSSSSTIGTAESLNSALVSSLSPAARPQVRRRVYDPKAPRLTPANRRRISDLAPLARRYRARTSINGTYARANRELTELCQTLYRSGASVRELSIAAGVTYRAMARRLGR